MELPEGKDPMPYGEGDDDPDLLGNDEDDDIDPNHHLLDRVQKALYDQLVRRKEQLEIKIRDRKEAVARIKKQREQTGVELYGFQQQLAKLQQDLESKHDFTSRTREERDIAEKRAKYLCTVLDETETRRDELEKKRNDEQKKLDQIKITVKQIDDHNKELKGEIKVTRRAAIGTEEGIKKAEKEKRQQDFLINEVNEQIKSIMEQTRLFESQIESQKEQTKIARETLAEAEKEIAKINVQKREYMQRWRTSLIGMKRRDESLQVAQKALSLHKEETGGVVVEILGLKKDIAAEQARNEQLTGVYNKLEAEDKYLETQNEKMIEEVERKQERHKMIQASMAKNEDQLKKEKQAGTRLRAHVSSLHKEYEKLVQKRQEVEKKIELELKGEVDTLKRGKQNLAKAVIKLRKEIQEKELDIADARNERARVRVDILSYQAANKSLVQTLKEFEDEVKSRDKIIAKYEAELKSTGLILERKQVYIARLNKKYDDATANQHEENTGPLEAVIKTLKRDIEKSKSDTLSLQRRWIGNQNNLVNMVAETEKVEKKVKEMRSRISVLEQKNLRLRNEHKQEAAESHALTAQLRRLHFDAGKLNKLIAESELLVKELKSENFSKEKDFSNELKVLAEAAQAQTKRIEALKKEKEEAILKVIEAEKQVMMLEKKIQLERETHAALDPEFGQPEIKGMKKEIHRMELRLAALKKHQELMIQQMERSIQRREMIQKGHEASKSNGDSRINLKKKISALRTALRTNMKEYKKIEIQVQDQERLNKSIYQDVEEMRRKMSQVEDDKLNLDHEVQQGRLKKRINAGRIMLLEKKSRRMQELVRRKQFTPEDHHLANMGLVKEVEVRQKIGQAIKLLQENYPKFTTAMQQLHDFMGSE